MIPFTHVKTAVLLCMLCFIIIFTGCGKKGDPSLRIYEKPAAPANLSAIHRENAVLLSWSFSEKRAAPVAALFLFRSAGGDFEKLTELDSGARSYSDSAVSPGTAYAYKIVALSPSGMHSNDSNILAITPRSVPQPPSHLTFRIQEDRLMLRWEHPDADAVFLLYKSYADERFPLAPYREVPAGTLMFDDPAESGKTVYYTVRAARGSAIRDESAASAVLAVSPSDYVPSAPVNLQQTALSNGIFLSWEPMGETWVRGFRIYRRFGTEFHLLAETQIPTYVDTEAPEKARDYRIHALGPVKEGPPSEITGVRFVPQR